MLNDKCISNRVIDYFERSREVLGQSSLGQSSLGQRSKNE